jgi:hypothetical protein
MKTKLIIICLIGMFIMGIAVAETIQYIRVTIDNSIDTEKANEKQIETITFDCDGKTMTGINDEPDLHLDERELYMATMRAGCMGVVTNVQNSKGEYLEQVGSYIGFDPIEKKKAECQVNREVYNEKTNDCEKAIVVEKPIEEPPIEEGIVE